MRVMLRRIVAWVQGSNSGHSDLHHSAMVFYDSTLLDPDCPDAGCSPQLIHAMRENSGAEPATRTLVRSFLIGHTVKVLLLKNKAQSPTTVIRGSRQFVQGGL